MHQMPSNCVDSGLFSGVPGVKKQILKENPILLTEANTNDPSSARQF
jgi:hypothetical protein